MQLKLIRTIKEMHRHGILFRQHEMLMFLFEVGGQIEEIIYRRKRIYVKLESEYRNLSGKERQILSFVVQKLRIDFSPYHEDDWSELLTVLADRILSRS